MNICITGGAGFLGSHLVERLAKKGHSLTVLDIGTYAACSWDYVTNYAIVHQGDVCSLVDIRDTMEGCDLVYHLAAQSHVDASLNAPTQTMETNAVGTQMVASFCAGHDIPLVYCSTDEVHGDIYDTQWADVGAKEDRTPLNPSSPYSAGKAAGEMAVRASARSQGLKAVITRGCNAFGPRQTPEKLIPIACRMIQRGERVPLHGGGSQTRQWVHASEFAEVLEAAGERLLEAPDMDGHVPTFNIAGPERWSVRVLVEVIANRCQVTEQPYEIVPDRPGQDRAYYLCGELTSEVLGITPKICITDRIQELLDAYPPEGDLMLAAY